VKVRLGDCSFSPGISPNFSSFRLSSHHSSFNLSFHSSAFLLHLSITMAITDKTQNILVTHAVLTGLTPLIPIPFVDDMVYSHFMRSMVRQLASTHGASLSQEASNSLTEQRGGCFALGCVGSILLFPLKKIFRKIFFFLEWKRAADIISKTYYQGFLIDAALQSGSLNDGNAVQVRAAMDAVLARTNTSLISRAAFGVVNQSKGALKSASALLMSYLPGVGSRPNEAEVAQKVAAVEEEEKQQVDGVVAKLKAAIANMPAEHFEALRREFEREIAGPSL